MQESLRVFAQNPRKLRLRTWAFNVHLYSGLTIGLILAAITLSGSAIVFRNAIGFALHRISRPTEHTPSAAPSLQSILDRTKIQNPGFTIAEIDGFSRTDGLLMVRLRREGHDGSDRDIFINTTDGQVVEGHPHLTNTLEYLEDFHKNLLMGRRGRGVNGVVALLFFAVVLTSPLVWWPGIARWTRAIKVNFALSWKRITYDLHSTVGMACVLFLAIMSVTAVLLATPDVLRLLSNPATASKAHGHHRHAKDNASTGQPAGADGEARQPRSHAPSPSKPSFTIDSAVNNLKAEESLKAWQLWSIRLPEEDEPLTAEFRRGTSSLDVDVDAASGQILNKGQEEGFGVSMDAHNFVEALHFGRVGGSLTQALWVLLGLSPTLLGVTGYLMWWNRVLYKRLAASGH